MVSRVGLILLGVVVLCAPARAATRLTITEFPSGVSTLRGLGGLTEGPDGAMWFADQGNRRIGRITLAGAITTFPAPGLTLEGTQSSTIATGPDGNLWFTEPAAGKIARMTPQGQMTEFAGPPAPADPAGLVSGPLGSLWFVNYHRSAIARITTDGAISEFPWPAGWLVLPRLTVGADGSLWFVGQNASPQNAAFVGRMTPDGTYSVVHQATGASQPDSLTAGSGSAITFADIRAGTIDSLDAAETVHAIRGGITNPYGIVRVNDGSLWFTGGTAGNVMLERLSPDGALGQFPANISPNGGPALLAAGPHDTLWFTDFDNRKIGRVTGLQAPFHDLSGVSVDDLRFSPGRFKVGSGRGRGSRVTFRMAHSARLLFTIKRPTRGFVPAFLDNCEPFTSTAIQGSGNCTFYAPVAAPTVRFVHAGANAFRFNGIVGGRRLAPGTYQLVVTTSRYALPIANVGYGFRIVR